MGARISSPGVQAPPGRRSDDRSVQAVAGHADSVSRSASRPGFALALLMLAAMISLLDRQILTLMVQPVRAALRITDTQVSLLQGLSFALLYAVMGLPLGWLVDRMNRRNLIVAAILVWSGMTVLCGLSTSFWQLFLARVGVGVGEAVLHPAAYSMIGDYFPPARRGRAFGLFSGAATFGISLSLFLGALLLAGLGHAPEVSLPLVGTLPTWKAVFVIVGLPGLPLALLMLTLREPPRRERALPTAGGRPRLAGFLRRNWRPLAIVLAPNALIALVGYGVIAWMATGFVRTYGLSPARAGLVCGAIMLVAAPAGALIGGYLGDRWTARGLAGGKMLLPVLTGVGGAVAFSAWWLAADLRLAIVFGAAAFTLQVATTAVAPAALNDLVPNELRGQMSAVFLLVTGLAGIGLGPTTIALVTDYGFRSDAALRYAIVSVAAPCLLAAALISWLGRQRYSAAVALRNSLLSDG
jgi:MFS family permease